MIARRRDVCSVHENRFSEAKWVDCQRRDRPLARQVRRQIGHGMLSSSF
jgi:hypothetical protein